ncbi:MAG: 30S ribosomal protein S20 [Candidatus Xenobia bacterium]
MPNIKSAKKMVKVIERRRVRNLAVRSAVKTAFKKATQAAGTATAAEPLVKTAMRLADKAASKGVVHKNKAARQKSRLMKRLNAAAAAKA